MKELISLANINCPFTKGLAENYIRDNEMLNCCLRIKITPNNYQKIKLENAINELICVAPTYGKNILNLYEKNKVCHVEVASFWEQIIQESNQIKLDYNKLDKYGQPRVKLYYKKLKKDLHNKRILIFGNSGIKDLGRIRVKNWVSDYMNFPENDETGGKHHMGGTAMSISKDRGIVDKNLKLFDHENIFVLGSSVYPSGGGYANPTFTIVQLALRLSKHLNNSVYI